MSKKTKIILLAVIAAALAVIIIIGASFNVPKTAGQKLGTAAIELLEKYEGRTIDADGASRAVGILMEKLLEEEKAETDSGKKQKLTSLWLDLMFIYTKLGLNGSATDSEVDETIQRIKSHL